MAELSFLDIVQYKAGSSIAMFLLADVELLESSKVVILGTDLEAYFTYKYLKSKDIKVEFFLNNDREMEGRFFCETVIVHPSNIVLRDYYIIIALSRLEYDNEAIWQLKVHQQDQYALAFRERFHCFSSDIQKEVLKVINNFFFMNGKKTVSEIVTPVYNVGPRSNILQKVFELCVTTTWSNCLLEWISEYIRREECTKLSMLDIGPGNGLFSAVVHEINPDIDISWLMFETEEQSVLAVKNKYTFYPADLFKTYYGVVESPQFQIEDKFDIIVMSEVIEHFVTNPVPVMKKIAGMLKEDGKIYLSTPNWPHLPIYDSYSDLPEFSTMEDYEGMYIGHSYQYSKSELEDVLGKSGLRIVKYGLSDSSNHNVILERRN